MKTTFKESGEAHYWLRLFKDSEILHEKDAQPLLDSCMELRRILASIVITSYKTNH